ncbi:MAG TPA: hypothetical protein VI316_04930, partial [Candidatus Dormibacteraeota bacterium]
MVVAVAPLLVAGERRWTVPDPGANVADTGSGSRVTWPDGVSLELDLQRLARGVRLTCRAAGLPVGLAVDGIGVSLRRDDVPGRILVDGYQSWDWAGVRDARRPGRGWWSAVWGDEHGGDAVPIALHLSQAPTTALTLA